MEDKFYYHKELRWLEPNEITIDENLRFYQARERTDLEHTIKESKFMEPITVCYEEGKYILLNGFDRMGIVSKNKLTAKIPTWVLLDMLSDVQKKKFIVDLAKQKQKTYVDYMNEYHLYNSMIPNEQGQKMDGKNRHKLIASMMGLSTSQLSKLLRIDKASPVLLAAVDNEHITLSKAEQQAKEILRKQRGESTDADSEAHDDKEIDINKAPLTHCPSCNRPLTDIKWDDLPDMFSFKKDETNSQTTWMEPLDNDNTKTNSNNNQTKNTSDGEKD